MRTKLLLMLVAVSMAARLSSEAVVKILKTDPGSYCTVKLRFCQTSPSRWRSRRSATSGQLAKVNRPFWPWVLLAALFVLMLEWVIYNKRVFV